MSLKDIYIGVVEKQRKQARIVVCITEPLLCHMTSGCVLDVSWNAKTHPHHIV